MPFCGKPVCKLCNSRIFIHRKFGFYMKLLLRPRTKRLIIPVDREAFGWTDPPDQEAFGWNGPPGREAFGRNGPRIRKSSDGTIHRARKPSGGAAHGPGSLRAERSTGPGSLRAERSTDQEVFGRNGPPGREAFGRNEPADQKVFGQHDPRRGVRSVLRNTLHGPRVRAPGASLLCARPGRPRHPSTTHSKGPARFQLDERRSRAGPPVCVRIWTPHPSTGGLVSTGAESSRQPNFVVQ